MAVALLGAILASSCALVEPGLPSDPPDGFEVAWSHQDCAPWDGPAVSVYLGARLPDGALSPTYPHVRVSIFAGPDEIPGRSYHWDGTGDVGDAQFCVSEGACERATAVTIEFDDSPTFDDSDARNGYRGHVGARFPDGSYFRGGFEARRLEFQALCG